MERKPRILVVDDEAATRMILGSILKKKNYDIVMAESGDEALELLKIDPDFNVILLDYLMVGTNGLEVLNAIRKEEKTCQIRVIFISGLDNAEEMKTAFADGASDYITKPFNASELLIRVEAQVLLSEKKPGN